MLQQLWSDNYKPGASGLEGAYAGKSYWICTYEWDNQLSSYPISTPLYDQAFTTGFATGFTPTFAIIGYNNKVYFDNYTLRRICGCPEYCHRRIRKRGSLC